VKQFIQNEKRALRRQAFRVKVILLKLLKEKWGIENYHLRPADQPRLVMFAVWAERHKVPLSYVLTTVITMGRVIGTCHKKKKTKVGLGLSLAALTSKKFEAMLVERIREEYPGETNIDEWRLREKEKALGLTEPRGKISALVDLRFTDAILYNYSQRIDKRAKRFEKGNGAQWRRRRRWRGNPWV
jgi:hypothetical protein